GRTRCRRQTHRHVSSRSVALHTSAKSWTRRMVECGAGSGSRASIKHSLPNYMHSGDRRIINGLLLAARPLNFNAVDLGTVAQAEMHGFGGLRKVATGRVDLPQHHFLADIELHQRADGVAIALGALELEGDVVFAWEVVLEVIGLIVEVVDDDFEPAVAI